MKRALVGALLAAVVGCGEPEAGLASSTEPIVGGESSGKDQDGVVLLRGVLSDDNELICTATLVAPNLVLTARHCVAYLSDGPFRCNARGELYDNLEGGGRLGLHLPAADLEIYAGAVPREAPIAHGARVLSTLSPTICINDIAFVVLDSSLDLPIVPVRLGAPAQVGEVTTLVGFGTDRLSAPIDYLRQARQQRRDLEIAAVGPDSVEDGALTAPPRSLLLRGPSGCLGDSGGPLLAQASGAVLGVYSLQSGEGCSAANVTQQLVHVSAFGQLIEEAFQAAGAEPLPEEVTGTTDGGSAGAPPSVEPSAGQGGASTEPSAGAPAAPEPEKSAPRESSCSLAKPGGDAGACWLVLGASLATSWRRRRANQRLPSSGSAAG